LATVLRAPSTRCFDSGCFDWKRLKAGLGLESQSGVYERILGIAGNPLAKYCRSIVSSLSQPGEVLYSKKACWIPSRDSLKVAPASRASPSFSLAAFTSMRQLE
jgi:hypothetical protein